MMISPDGFINSYKNKSYKELLPVRDKLIREIRKFEKNSHELENDIIMDPSPEVIYQCNLEYLGELCKLISYKYNQEFIWGVANDPNSPASRTREWIDRYFDQFPYRWEEQKYIWKAVKTFQDCWDLDAPDLSEMIERATSDAEYLMNASLYYPRDMIIGLAKVNPKEVKQMFLDLFDEETDVATRALEFNARAEQLRGNYKGKFYGRNYQTMNAISTYLWLMYPEKYYFYKYAVANKVSAETGLPYTKRNDSEVNKMINEFELMDMISEALRKDRRARKLLDERLDDTMYYDGQLHCMAMDFAFFIRPCYENRKS